jgi:iron complex outermembrane recepter protein
MLVRAAALLLLAGSLGAQEAPPEVPAAAARIDVVASAPVDAVGLERNDVPANVLIVEPDGGASSTDALARSTASVQVNDAQHNPMQRDVQFRGFTASPLLGVPQGLAVYADGARMNEPFGDVVNWDLLPDAAIEQIEVLPGSNPLFGLNALGGVLSLRTRSGRSSPGVRASVAAGSLGLVRAEGTAGFGSAPWDGFVAASAARDAGWRDHSPSRHGQLFAKATAVRPRAFFETSLTFSDGNLRGNGPAPAELLEEDWRAVFTHPDVTENRAAAVNGRGEWHLARDTIAVVHLHARRVTTDRFNGDDSPFEPCAENEEILCEEDSDEEVLSIAGEPIASTIGGAPADGANNTSRTISDTGSLTAQVHRSAATGAIRHQLLGGITAEGSRSRFSSDLEIASLTADRGTRGHAIQVAEDAVRLDTRSRLFALHLRDSMRLGRGSVLLALRHQRSTLDLEDRLGDELTGRHTFSRTNASLGATVELSPRLTLFAAAGEASRAPTAVEVTCADPEDPCRLPNAFVSDPPLRQVVTRTWELGARGQARPFRWSAAAFDARNRDDILFIASGTTQGEGFFANVGTTRRRGVEALLSSQPASRVAWMASYTLLDAAFGDAVTMPSRSHPLAEEGQIEVRAGDRIPGLSRHAARWSILVPVSQSVRAGIDGRHQSSQYVRGDEANLLRPLPGVTVWNASLEWQPSRRVEITATVENLLDERYATFGLLADAADVLGDDYEDPLFVSPGAPRNVRVLVSWRW